MEAHTTGRGGGASSITNLKVGHTQSPKRDLRRVYLCPRVVGMCCMGRGKEGIDGQPWYSDAGGDGTHLLHRTLLDHEINDCWDFINNSS